MTIKPWAWWFLLGSILLLVVSLLVVNLQPGWLGSVQLNPLVQRSLPEPWQVSDPWRHVILPVALALGVALVVPTLPRRPWSHALVLSLLLLAAIRYFLWRSTTINTAHPISLVASLTLFACEVVYLITTTLQFYPSIFFDPMRRRRQADRLAGWATEQPPSVDIWIPTYNEPTRMVRRCVLACKNIDHPRKTITVLDDGHRPAMAELAQELGVNYLSRPDNQHRKAGNLNYALARTSGDLIAVFDCDFVPFRNFLRRTTGFFSDPGVALVQTPQHYFNADAHNRNLGLESVMPDDMDYFFNYLQVIRDRFNAVICCGTSYVARRSAIEAAGGYVTSCIIEDHQTSTKLLTQGWRVVYLDEILSLGEVPRSFRDYLDQRLRWMQGNFQIFYRDKELPIWSKLTFWQQSFYFNLLVSLFTPFFRLAYILLPLASLVMGFTLIAAPPIEYLAYGVPFILLLYTLPTWLTNHHHFQFWNEVYEALFCFPAVTRIVRILRRPFGILGSLVTNKEVSGGGGRLDLGIAWPFLTYLAVLAAMLLLLYGAPLLNPAWGRSRFEGESLMLAWNLYNAWVMLTCLLACIDRPIERGADRFPLEQIVRLDLGGTQMWGVTTDISEQGASVRLRPGTSAPSKVPGATGQLALVESSVEVPVELVTAGGDRGGALLRLQFGPLGERQESALIELIYNGSAWYQKPRRVGTLDALLILIGSVWKIVPAQPQGKMDPH
jgi:cellulose synthase (UDP-forming)